MKLTTEQYARITDAHETQEIFKSVTELAALVPGFYAFSITKPHDPLWGERQDPKKQYCWGSELFMFEDPEGNPTGIYIRGTLVIPCSDIENWPKDTTSITEWRIEEIL